MSVRVGRHIFGRRLALPWLLGKPPALLRTGVAAERSEEETMNRANAIRRILVIANPVSGQTNFDKTRARIEERLAEAGIEHRFCITEGAGDAKRWAEEAEGVDRVVVAGGDGTVMEVLSGLVGRDIPLGQIPTGTANLLAQALGIPGDVEEALELALTGGEVPFDVGYLPDRDRYFSLVAGAGWDAQLIEDASRDLKNRLGFFAYVVTGIKNLFDLHRSDVRVEIDGEIHRFRAHTVMVVNVGGLPNLRLGLGNHIDPHDGKLDIALIAPEDVAGMMRLATRLLQRRYESDNDLRFLSAERLKIEAWPPLQLQIDGEAIGTTPLTVEVVADGVRLIVPDEYRRRFEETRSAAEQPPEAVQPEG